MLLTRKWNKRQKLLCGLLALVVLTAGPVATGMFRSTAAHAATYAHAGGGDHTLSEGLTYASSAGYGRSGSGLEAHSPSPYAAIPPKAPVITSPPAVWLIIGGIVVAFATWAIAFNYLRCGKWRC